MGLLRLGLLGAAGYGMYRFVTGRSDADKPAFAKGEGARGNDTQIRNAGPQSMRDEPRAWSATDEASDESFPASDPPANY